MNRQQRHDRASAALGVLGALLIAGLVLVALWNLAAAIPPGWWLPIEARPFGGRWPFN